MRIESKHTLSFTITSENPPHELACAFILRAAEHHDSEVTTRNLPMTAVDHRTTEFNITDGSTEALRSLADCIRAAMALIGVAMSESVDD